MTFEDSTDLKQENAYKKAYDAAKAKWIGKYNDETTCKPKENVNPNEWKFQDSDDVCGGNAKCINVKNALDEINKSSNIANQYACNKLGRDSCKVMNEKYNDCVNKKIQFSCPRGQEPDRSKCNRTNGTTICKACPNCGSNEYRVDNGVPTKDGNGNYIYCGTCKKCGTGKNIGKYEYLEGCNGLNSGTVKSCSGKTCPGIQVIVGCNKDGSPICENPTQCSTSQFRQGRTKTVKGTCTPKTKCATTQYLSGFVKATSTTDGKNGTCKPCVTCPGDQKYMSGCSDTTGAGQCLTMTCGNCGDSAQIKLGCVRSSPSSNTFNPKCQYCKPGQRKDGNKCVACPIGQYSSGSRPTNCTPCNTCSDVGLKTNNCASPGSTKDNVCHNKANCSSGKYASIGNPPSCSPCPANTQQPKPNNNEGKGSCLPCDKIRYSSAGSSTCLQRNCDANHYVEPKEGGGAVCKKITSDICPSTCPSNQIKTGCKKRSASTNMQQLNSVQTNCITCVPGKYKATATSCSKKICPCPQGGTRAEGTNCPTHGQTKCQTCNNGYVRGSGNTCVLKTCSCPNGTPTTGVTCANGQNCSACNRGYHLSADKKRCILNSCTCSHGTGYTGSNCPTNGQNKCQTCNTGYRKVSDRCYANNCTCDNGYRATGASCTTHNSHICRSCYSGYTLTSGKCIAPAKPTCPSYQYYNNTYKRCYNCRSCVNGYSQSICPADGQKKCRSCYSGYQLSSGKCVPKPSSSYSYTSYYIPPAKPAASCKKAPSPGRCGGSYGKCNRYRGGGTAYCSSFGYCGSLSSHGRGSTKSSYNSDSSMCAIA